MRAVISTALLLAAALGLGSSHSFAAVDGSKAKVLSDADLAKVFDSGARAALGMDDYGIFRAWRYSDASGQYYLVLTEREYSRDGNKPLNSAIRAFNFRIENDRLRKVWVMNDFLDVEREEDSIWFWTKYIDPDDYDGDGLYDPIIVYGSSGPNGFSDGRMKILIYYKNNKVAIRHQNGVLDPQRHTQIDAEFYDLPGPIQMHVKEVMRRATGNGHALFPGDYLGAMKQRSTDIDVCGSGSGVPTGEGGVTH